MVLRRRGEPEVAGEVGRELGLVEVDAARVGRDVAQGIIQGLYVGRGDLQDYHLAHAARADLVPEPKSPAWR